MAIILRRKFESNNYESIIELAISKNKEYYQAIVELIYQAEKQKRNKIKEIKDKIAIDIVFRPEFPILVERLLRVLKDDLSVYFEDGGYIKLTEIGEKLRETGKIFEPMNDGYLINTIIKDHLIGTTILQISPIEISKNNKNDLVSEVFKMKESNKKHNNSSKSKNTNNDIKPSKLPKELLSLKDNEFEIFDKGVIKILNIEPKGKVINKRSKYEIIVEVNTDDNISIFIEKENKKIERQKPKILAKITYHEILRNILLNDGYKYSVNDKVIHVNKNQLEELLREDRSMLDSFKTNLKISEPSLKIDGEFLGTYEKIEIKNISVIPKNKETALYWAKEMLKDSVNYYLSKNQYDELCFKIRNLPKFIEYELILPKFEEAVRELNVIIFTPKYWYLQGSNDLLLEEIT